MKGLFLPLIAVCCLFAVPFKTPSTEFTPEIPLAVSLQSVAAGKESSRD